MKAPLVSIVVPAFNAERCLRATLESALAQTWPSTEVIVVDDGSSDGTPAVAAGFATRGVRLLCQPNRGASAARNLALAAARGDYVQFLDADDLVAPDKIEIQLRALQHVGAGKLASCAWARFTNDPSEARFVPMYGFQDLSPYEFLYESAMERGTFPPVAWLVPRRLCDAAGPWDDRLSVNDDGEYFARVLAQSSGIVFCGNARAYYRSNDLASYSNRFSLAAARSEMLAWRSIAATILALEDSPRSHKAVATGYQRLQVRYYGHFPEIVEEAERLEREHGKGAYRFEGGLPFHLVRALFGWRAAIRLRQLKTRLRRSKSGGPCRQTKGALTVGRSDVD